MDGYGLSKIILIGEHSVVYGNKAVAIPFYSLRSEVVLTPSSTFIIDTKYYTGPFVNAPKELDGLVALIEAMKDKYPGIFPVFITIRSNLPERSGLGSSASVAKALIDAFNKHFNLGLSQNDYFDFLKISEDIYHASASGIDASTIIYEKPLIFKKPEVTPLNLNIDGYLVVFYSKTNSATREAVLHVKHHQERDRYINEISHLTDTALFALQNNDLLLLGETFNKCHTCLRNLGVSTPYLENLREFIFANNAVGVKITGGGMGGCLIALFRNEKEADEAIKNLNEFPSWKINLRNI